MNYYAHTWYLMVKQWYRFIKHDFHYPRVYTPIGNDELEHVIYTSNAVKAKLNENFKK